MSERVNGTVIGVDGKPARVPIKATGPDANGLYKLLVDASVSVGSLDLGLARLDGELAAALSNGDLSEVTIDGNGHIWIAGRDIMDAIKKAGDCVQTVTSRNGINQPLTIDYESAYWQALLGSGTLKVTDTLTYLPTGEWDTLTPSLTP